MKILDFSHADLDSMADPLKFPQLGVATDSSLVINPKPLFLPETSTEWSIELSVAIRIDRLGKRIARRFATRYYEMATVMAHAVPADQQISSTPWAEAVDSSWLLGNWQPSSSVLDKEITVSLPGEADRQFKTQTAAVADIAIESLSRFFTLKNGDIIVLPGSVTLPAVIGSRLSVTTTTAALIESKIK